MSNIPPENLESSQNYNIFKKTKKYFGIECFDCHCDLTEENSGYFSNNICDECQSKRNTHFNRAQQRLYGE